MILGRGLHHGALQGDGLPRGVLHLTLCLIVLAAVVSAFVPESGGSGPDWGRPTHPDAAPIAESAAAEFADDAPWQEAALGGEATGGSSSGTGDSASAPQQSAAGEAAARLTTSKYTVQPGDSLAGIAEQFGIDVPTLLGSNDLDDPDLLPTGLELRILPVRGVLHRVADGETLNRIAAQYELVVRDIMRANDIRDSELIAIGDELVLPGARPIPRAPAGPVPAEDPSVELAPAARVEQRRVELAAAVVLPPSSGARPSFVWPATGRITTYFGAVGWTAPRGHAGLDIAAPWGAPVRAAAGGQVIVATHAGGPYGVQAIIDHGSGLRTVYGHLSELHVAAGERVERGELIGLVGSTGFSTGPHLHFEIRENGELRDPLKFLP